MKDKLTPGLKSPSKETLKRLAEIVGDKYALRNDTEMAPYLVERRDTYFGKAAMVLRPGTTREVSEILSLANQTRTAIVPQGGNTGLVGAQIPFESGNEIILCLDRLNRIRDIDLDSNSITVEAGVILQNIQSAASDVNRLFPLSLAAQGSCQIGGNIATNAGGVGVLAYGNTRSLVLGLEFVLPDGRIIDDLKCLRKDNTGYDLKNLMVGSEGTLGVITAAALRLFPKPTSRATAFAGLESLEQTQKFFNLAMEIGGSQLTSFEVMVNLCLDIIMTHVEGAVDPLEQRYPWNVLLEISSTGKSEKAESIAQNILETAFEQELVSDGTLASSLAQSDNLWHIREELSETQRLEGASLKCDISIPIARIPEFIKKASSVVTELCPNCRPIPFGHYGDGNIHFNVLQPVEMNKNNFLELVPQLAAAVNEIVISLDGSISAEHGIGRLKREMLQSFRSEAELDLMRGIKNVFDPNGIMNPGKVI